VSLRTVAMDAATGRYLRTTFREGQRGHLFPSNGPYQRS
jgi:hypothetical protein